MRHTRKDREQKKLYVREYKSNKGCSVCGYNEIPEALELDHIDRTKKNFKLSRACYYGWDAIYKELENCLVLCANCHRKKTTKDKDYLELEKKEKEILCVQYDLFGEHI